MLNRRREIMNKCLHKDRCKLSEIRKTETLNITKENYIDVVSEEEVEELSPDDELTEEEVEEPLEATASIGPYQEGPDEGQVHNQPEQHEGEVDQVHLRRSKRTNKSNWQCLQYSRIIERNPD